MQPGDRRASSPPLLPGRRHSGRPRGWPLTPQGSSVILLGPVPPAHSHSSHPSLPMGPPPSARVAHPLPSPALKSHHGNQQIPPPGLPAVPPAARELPGSGLYCTPPTRSLQAGGVPPPAEQLPRSSDDPMLPSPHPTPRVSPSAPGPTLPGALPQCLAPLLKLRTWGTPRLYLCTPSLSMGTCLVTLSCSCL